MANNVSENVSMNPAREHDGYNELLKSIRDRFSSFANSDTKRMLYTTDGTKDLYDILLRSIPEEARQHYNCNTCRHFVNKYGGLVVIDQTTGAQSPVMWNPDAASDFFKPAVTEIWKTVHRAKVNGVFATSQVELGHATTGPWNHMAVNAPEYIRYTRRADSVNERIAAVSENRRLLAQSLAKYSLDVIRAALNLIQSGQIAGTSIIKANAEWFYDISTQYQEKSLNKHNFLWAVAATAPTGYCHINSNLFGTMLEDIANGMTADDVKAKYEVKAAPDKYQRSVAAPSSGAIREAEKRFAELGLENSLKRRYARLEEIQTIWVPEPEKEPEKKTGIFSDIVPKDAKSSPKIAASGDDLNPTPITWEKFRSTVLSTGKVKKMEFRVSGLYHYPFAAILTAVDMDAPPIVLWDKPEERNPYSWYTYSEGSYPSDWSLNNNRWVSVTAISETPNLWSNFLRNENDKGVIFILEGCKDRAAIAGVTGMLGLFATNCRKDIYEFRSVLEAYGKTHAPEDPDKATACGILLQDNPGRINGYYRIRVTTDLGTTVYNIDRWD